MKRFVQSPLTSRATETPGPENSSFFLSFLCTTAPNSLPSFLPFLTYDIAKAGLELSSAGIIIMCHYAHLYQIIIDRHDGSSGGRGEEELKSPETDKSF